METADSASNLIKQINLLDAIYLIERAWGFHKSGLIIKHQVEPIEIEESNPKDDLSISILKDINRLTSMRRFLMILLKLLQSQY